MTTDAESEPPTRRRADKLKEFYFAVGVAMVRWQDVDFELTRLFCLLVGGERSIASAVFNTVPSFPTKLRMVKAAAAIRLADTNLFKLCDQLCDDLDDTQRKRNQIAHFMLLQDSPVGDGMNSKKLAEEIEWYLAPSTIDGARYWRHKGKPPQLKISDIESRTQQFGEASDKIRDFVKQVEAALK
jgi:hypothetical protein